MSSATINALMGLPMGRIAAAYQHLTGDTPNNSKAAMVRAVASAVDSGAATLQDVRSGVYPGPGPLHATLGQPVPPAPRPSPQRAQDPTLREDLQDLAGRVSSIDDQVKTTIGDLTKITASVRSDIAQAQGRTDGLIQAAQSETKSLRAQIQALSDKVGQITIPQADMQAAMRIAVEEAFAPIKAAAQANGTEAQVLAQAQAGPVSEEEAVFVFGVDVRDAKGKPLMFSVYDHPEAPKIDPAFIWTESIIRHLYVAQRHGRNMWMGGPAGTGKTQTAQQFAARTGRMFRRFVFDRFSTRDDFLGAMGLNNGSTMFEPGPVLEAYTTPGAVCLLDEVGMGQPAALSALNAFLERQASVAYADRVWHRASGTMFLAADNSLTQGDQSGRFAGVQAMNTAFSDRFSLVVPFQYLDPGTEAAALVAHTNCTRALADHLINALVTIRSKVQTGDIIDPPSIRQMIAFIEALSAMEPAEAWRSAIAARQPVESEAALAAVFAACIDIDLINREI